MNIKDTNERELASAHVDWYLDSIRSLLVDHFVHGYKHGREDAFEDAKKEKSNEDLDRLSETRGESCCCIGELLEERVWDPRHTFRDTGVHSGEACHTSVEELGKCSGESKFANRPQGFRNPRI